MCKKVIEINDFSFLYKENKVLDHVNLVINEGSLTALIGLNGAGKTTIFNTILKQFKIENNKIYIYGEDVNNLSLKKLSKIVSIVPQISYYKSLDISVRDFLVEARTPYLSVFSIPKEEDYLIVRKYAHDLEIEKFLDRSLNSLSGGELQLILVARALIQETPILLMDEPTSALDLCNQAKMLSLIKKINKENKKTILFTTHDLNHALAIKSNVCILNDGKICMQGLANEIISTNNLNEIYGDAVKIIKNKDDVVCKIVI